MLSTLLWLAGLLFEFLLLVRALQAKTFTKYIYFYAYILGVFCVSVGLYIGRAVSPEFYEAWYWPTQFATLALGCGVVLEIVRQALAAYHGAERIARLASWAVFVATFCYWEWYAARRAEWLPFDTTVLLERDLRVIQALVMATVLAVVFYYRIELGRNVIGMIVGFGFYVGMSLTTLAVRAFAGPRFNAAWAILQTTSYLLATVVWTFALWSYHPNPAAPVLAPAGAEYDALVHGTKARLEMVRSHLRGVARP
jgi:hypothetical protein